LFDEAEGVKDSADHAVTELGDTVFEVFDWQAEQEQTRVLDLQAVVEDRDANRRATLRVVRMRNRVDYGFSYGDGREVPAIRPANSSSA
jgi:hypothetical protein